MGKHVNIYSFKFRTAAFQSVPLPDLRVVCGIYPSLSRKQAVARFILRLPLEMKFCTHINSSPPGHNGRHFADDTFIYIFMNENICSLIRILLKFISKCPIDNKPALVQVMAWRRTDDKPLPEPMITQFTDAYMQH